MTAQRKLRALITGASRGIGRATAEAFAASNIDLVLVSRSQAQLDELAQTLQKQGVEGPGLSLIHICTDVYAQLFDSRGKALCDAQAIAPSELADLVSRLMATLPPYLMLAGNAWQQVYDVLVKRGYDVAVKQNICPYLAENLAFYLMQQKRLFIGCSNEKPRPFYLRPPNASLPKAWGHRMGDET